MDNPLDKPAAKVGSGPPLEPKQKIRVLLVDDDPMIGRGLARNLSLMRVKMDLTVCTSAMEALRILERTFVDVIVTDLYMPGMDGSALLHEVRARYPTILRFVLSGEANPEIVLQATRVAHLYLAKPCETAALHKAIVETLAQMATIKNPQVAMTLSHLEGVPSLQNILVEFIHLLTDSGASVEPIATSLRKDPALSARVLRVANAPYFGHSGSVESLDDAVGLLGLDMIRSMAATQKLLAISPPAPTSNLNLEQLWEHCVYVSSLVRRIGNNLKVSPAIFREASTAALLHDIGKLVLAYATPSEFATACALARAERMPVWQAEYSILGNHHAEIGGCLLKLWGLPRPIVDAVSLHHTPQASAETRVGPATLVHIADALALADDDSGVIASLDSAHLKSLDVSSDMEYWKTLARES